MNAEKSNSLLKTYATNPELLYNKTAYENDSTTLMHPIQMIKQMFNTRKVVKYI